MYKLVRSFRHSLAHDVVICVKHPLHREIYLPLNIAPLLPPTLADWIMAYIAPITPASRISITGTIYPPWWNVDECASQPVQDTGVIQKSPTIAGASPQEAIGSTPEHPTRRASRNDTHTRGLGSNSERPSTRELRQRRSKACAQCKKSKTKCILEEERFCQRYVFSGVQCNLPASRRLHEKELNLWSGKVGSQRCVFATTKSRYLLTYD